MSRSSSVSLEIVPPTRGLAAVLDAAFKSNSKQNGSDSKGLTDAEADLEEEPPAPKTQSNTVNIITFYPGTCSKYLITTLSPQLQPLDFHRLHASVVSGQKRLAKESRALDANIASV